MNYECSLDCCDVNKMSDTWKLTNSQKEAVANLTWVMVKNLTHMKSSKNKLAEDKKYL